MGHRYRDCRYSISDIQRVCTLCDDPMDPDNKTSVKAYWNFALEAEDERKDCLQIFSCDDEVRRVFPWDEDSTKSSICSVPS